MSIQRRDKSFFDMVLIIVGIVVWAIIAAAFQWHPRGIFIGGLVGLLIIFIDVILIFVQKKAREGSRTSITCPKCLITVERKDGICPQCGKNL